jgi:CRP/FNR family transcriptional regulator, cyclic AMP receptor protein
MRKVLFLFGQLQDNDVEWMIRAGNKRVLSAGERLILQGVQTDGVFILLAGKLAVRLRPKQGEEREIARLNAGGMVGEMSFVDARPPSATVEAVEDSTVFVLDKAVLAAKLGKDLGLAARFYKALAMYLSTTVRERHRAIEPGTATGMSQVDNEDDDAEELDANVLDGVYLAGERFDRMVKRAMVS